MKRTIIAGVYLLFIIICCLVFTRHIFLYNAGNRHYRNADYTGAIESYEKALKASPPKRQECSIRINLALSMIYNLGDDYDQPDYIDDSIQTLKEARAVLLEEDCATADGDGHNATSEQLKTEIEKLIEKLEQQTQSASGDDADSQDENQSDVEDAAEQNIKEQLQQIQDDAYKQRQEGLDFTEELDMDYNFDMDTPIW